MMKFTDEVKIVRGTSMALLEDMNGNIVYYDDHYDSATIESSVDMNAIRGGVGNPLICNLPSNANITVNFSTAAFSAFIKTQHMGASLTYSAPVSQCQTVTASSSALSFTPVGTPVAESGLSTPYCYVQEVGKASPVAVGGTAYKMTSSSGTYTVTGFTATSGKQYKVYYYINKPTAQQGKISTNLNPGIFRFRSAHPVYTTKPGSSALAGTRIGTLHYVLNAIQFDGTGGGVNGSQTENDTSVITASAISYTSDVVSADCEGCSDDGNTLGYFIWEPCNTSAADYQGIVANIGPIAMAQSATYQMTPKAVMATGELAPLDVAQCTFTATGAPSGASVSATGLITSATTGGDFTVKVQYTVGTTTYQDTAEVTIAS